MTAHSCSRRHDDPCPAKRPGMTCSLPRGHTLPHAKCVSSIGVAGHRAYEWWGRCHEEVIDSGGYLDACNASAVTSVLDEDGQQYPVCNMHRSRTPEGADA